MKRIERMASFSERPVVTEYEYVAGAENSIAFTCGNWNYRYSDAVVNALDTEVELKEYVGGDPAHVTFAAGVLTEGNTYIVTFIPVDDHNAKIKVSEKK